MRYHIYKIINILDGNFYIGVHDTNGQRKNYLGSGTRIRNAVNKYGKKNFVYTVLYETDVLEHALAHEKSIITKRMIKNRGCYNLTVGGGLPPSHKGTKKSKSWKETISKIKSGNTYNSKTWYIHGHEFKSSREAAKFFGVSQRTIWNWTKRDDMPDCYSEENEFVHQKVVARQPERPYSYFIRGFVFRTIKEASEFFGVSYTTPFYWIKNKNIPNCYNL